MMKRAGLAILILILLGVGAFFVKTEWFVNDRSFHWAARRYLPENYQTPVAALTLHLEPQGFLRKKVVLRGEDVCIKAPRIRDLCSPSIEISILIDWRRITAPIRKLEKLDLAKVTGTYLLSNAKSPRQARPPEATETVAGVLELLEGLEIPRWLSHVEFNDVHLGIDHLTLRQEASQMSIRGDLGCRPRPGNGVVTCAWVFTESSDSYPFPHSSKWVGSLEAIERHPLRPEVAKIQVQLDAKSLGSLSSTVLIERKAAQNWSVRWQGDSRLQALRAKFDLNGGITSGAADGILVAHLPRPIQGVSELRISDCGVHLDFLQSGAAIRAGRLRCQLLAFPSRPPRRWRGAPLSAGPIRANLEATMKREGSDRLLIESRIAFQPGSPKAMPLTGWIESRFLGRAREFVDVEKQKITCRLDFKKLPWEDARTFVRIAGIVIPAPFNTLAGDVSVAAACQPQLKASEMGFAVTTESRLTSPNQVLAFTHTGTLRLVSAHQKLRAILDADVKITEAQVILPDVSLRTFPRFFPSEKIVLESKKRKSKIPESEKPFQYRIRIHTDSQPIRLLTTQSSSAVPVIGEVLLSSDSPMRGNVAISGATMKVFRRTATVESLAFTINPRLDSPEIRGRISIRYPDYTVFILLSGTADAPQTTMISDPPLPPDEVVSVLLFGAPTNDIGLEDNATVQSAQALFLSRSVNLLSLYVLASTPVQRIDFNPDSNEVSALIRVSDKTTLNVGAASGEEATAGIVRVRRRVGKSWAIVTGFESVGRKSSSAASAWLEWSKRY